MAFDFNKVLSSVHGDESAKYDEYYMEHYYNLIKDYGTVCNVDGELLFDMYDKLESKQDDGTIIQQAYLHCKNNVIRFIININSNYNLYSNTKEDTDIFAELKDNLKQVIRYFKDNSITFDNKVYITNKRPVKDVFTVSSNFASFLLSLYDDLHIVPEFTGYKSVSDFMKGSNEINIQKTILFTCAIVLYTSRRGDEYNDVLIPFGNMVKRHLPQYNVIINPGTSMPDYTIGKQYFVNSMFGDVGLPMDSVIAPYIAKAFVKINRLTENYGISGNLLSSCRIPNNINTENKYKKAITDVAVLLLKIFKVDYLLHYYVYNMADNGMNVMHKIYSRCDSSIVKSEEKIFNDIKSYYNWLCKNYQKLPK